MKVSEVKELIVQSAEDALQEYGIDHNDNYGTFLYGLPPEQNLQYNQPLPHIYLDPIRRTWNSDTQVAEYPVTMYFLAQDTADSTGEQMSEIENAMESLQDKFLSDFMLLERFNDTTFTSTPLHRVNMGMFTGWQLNFTLTAKHVIC